MIGGRKGKTSNNQEVLNFRFDLNNLPIPAIEIDLSHTGGDSKLNFNPDNSSFLSSS